MTSQFELFEAAPVVTLADADARRAILEDLDHNIVVRAGAGAGKTEALVGRMVACIRSGNSRVDQLVAITFTRKAAGELKQRFTERLVEANERATGGEAARLREALLHVDECFVGTIHAFCARLLRERPIEAGLQPDFVELDERDDLAVWTAVSEQFVEDLYARGDPLLEGLAEVGVRMSDLGSFLRLRYDSADVPLKVSDVPMPSLLEAVTEVARLIEDAMPYLPGSWTEEDDFTRMARRAVLAIENSKLDTTLRHAEFLSRALSGLKSSSVKYTKWRDKGVGKRFRDDLIPKVVADHVDPAMTAWRQYAYTKVVPVADRAIEYYEAHRRKDGLVTFFDLLERSVALLRDHPNVRAHFQRRYSRLFVDEFQDTDPLQARMLLLLTSQDLNERDWTRARPLAGSLFIVGDEKQSIYRFRRADIEIFRAVSDQIERSGGRVVDLTTSFRTLGSLCATLNSAFGGIFALESPKYQAPFAKLDAFRPPGDDETGARRLVYSGKADVEAARVADFIAAAIAGSTEFNALEGEDDDTSTISRYARPSDFLVVARERRHLGEYARALEARGIPFDISGGDSLGKSQELGLLVDLLSVVEDPTDPVAYLKYLRGELAGTSDTEFYDYKRSGGTFSFVRDARIAIEDPRIAAARDRVICADRYLKELPPYAAIWRIVEDFGLLAFSAALPEGTLRAGSMKRVLSYVRQWAGEGKGWVDILRELRGLIRDTVATIETMTLEVGRFDVVRIMTVHQAKGLQAAVVILADDQKVWFKGTPKLHVSRVGAEEVLSAAVSPERRQVIAEPVGWESDAATEMMFAAAEDTRIRYVAATRARNLLVVCEGESGYWTPLLSALTHVPVLPEYPEAKRNHASAPIANLDSLRDIRDKAFRSAAEPSRTLARVTGDEESTYVPATFGGRGREFGSAVHAILEQVFSRPDEAPSEAYVSSMLEHSGSRVQDANAVATVRDGISKLMTSTLWARATAARRRYTEVDVVVRERDEIIRGTIDLVFSGMDGWEIVDFKTDHVGGADDLRRLSDAYTAQLLAYVASWERISGEKVARAGLWLFETGQEVRIM